MPPYLARDMPARAFSRISRPETFHVTHESGSCLTRGGRLTHKCFLERCNHPVAAFAAKAKAWLRGATLSLRSLAATPPFGRVSARVGGRVAEIAGGGAVEIFAEETGRKGGACERAWHEAGGDEFGLERGSTLR